MALPKPHKGMKIAAGFPIVSPAQAGVHNSEQWIPAKAGMAGRALSILIAMQQGLGLSPK
jgi:hypothetical protein